MIRTPTAALRSLLRVSDEVAEAVRRNRPVVALESTIYTHGGLGKDLVQQHLDVVRRRGGVPAVVAVVDGVPSVGVSARDMARLMEEGAGTVKASRRDLAYLAGSGLAGRPMHGGTTIAGTMLLARLAGIRVFGTGGLGGVHRDGQNSMDVSADLSELGRTRMAVVCSGCKGFLDIPRTLEVLETHGCLVATFADGRDHGAVDFPAFWARDSGTASPAVVDNEKQAAAIILAQERLEMESGIVFANPIPREAAIPSDEMSAHIEQAVREAADQGFTGSANTPFVLRRLKQLAGDRVVDANKTLAAANIARATDIAVELSRMLQESPRTSSSVCGLGAPKRTAPVADTKADIFVAGAVAVDLSCHHISTPGSGDDAPRPCTSNPARITQSIGGVGYNVSLAAHLASREARVRFCSMVGDDVAGSAVLSSLQTSGFDTSHVQMLQHPDARTAQYVAVNDGSGSLVMAMADMAIFTQHSFPEQWASTVSAVEPKWLVVDCNWSPRDIRAWLTAGREHGAKVALEPVSVAKSRRLFCPQAGMAKLGVYPRASVHLATPNVYELEAMHAAASGNGYLELGDWFNVIDSFEMRGARDKFVRLTSPELTDGGVPVQSVQLLPYMPTILTKLGSRGVLVTALLGRDDPLLRDADADEFTLTRAASNHPSVGGIYMRLFPAVEQLPQIVSVNGAGDTFLGVMISGLAQGGRVEDLVDVAQSGAVLSLGCREAVSPELWQLEEAISRAVRKRNIRTGI